jgi:hypothetical protein
MSISLKSFNRYIHAMLIVGLLSASSSPSAQNVLTNPNFDDDLNAWTVFYPGQTFISRTVDYRTADSVAIRSLQIDSTDGSSPHFAFVAQCADVHESLVYVASVEVDAHCSGQQLFLFWADASCMAGDSVMAQSTRPDEWERLAVSSLAPLGTQKALVVLENPATCAGSAYFDAVSLSPDRIFNDGFEVVTPP